MKKRILAVLLCAVMTVSGFVYTFADGELMGDANGDGKITVADASLILRYLAGIDYRMNRQSRYRADLNCNGRVDAEEAAAILRHITGQKRIQEIATDTELLRLLNKQTTLGDAPMTEWVTRYIQSLPDGDVKNVLYAGAQYMGTPYGTGYKQLDCSLFVKAAFADANIPKTVYPGKSSNETIIWYTDPLHPERLSYFHETDECSWEDWKPGCVLIYVNADTGKGSHLALYVGEIDGEPVVMESRGRNSPVNGVRIGYLMGSSTSWDLRYYVDPLG